MFARQIFFHSLRALTVSLFLYFSILSGSAQSGLQEHPTPITQNEIAATIKARDVGDARLTTHYYWFDGGQGDVFINLWSRNFAGDVDVFVQSGLRPLTKIVVYSDFGEVETGRVIYLRKPERLLLRVQGRTPNDDEATYRLKFAGSFVAAAGSEKDVPEMPTVAENVTGSVRVNSVGTIIPPPPKPIETKLETSREPNTEAAEKATAPRKDEEEKLPEAESNKLAALKETPKPEVVVEDLKKADTTEKTSSRTKRPPRRQKNTSGETAKKVETAPNSSSAAETGKEKMSISAAAKEKEIKPEPKADPLASVHLVIMFKDGRKIERPLLEVFRFSVDRGVLTVVAKDGRVGKYQMVDVAKVTIE